MSEFVFYMALSGIILFLFIVTVIYCNFYQKYNQELSDAFYLLCQKGYSECEGYCLNGIQGFFTFGIRALLMRKILKGKRARISQGHWLEAGAGKIVQENYQLLWLNSYNNLFLISNTLYIMILIVIYFRFR